VVVVKRVEKLQKGESKPYKSGILQTKLSKICINSKYRRGQKIFCPYTINNADAITSR
jgi:hypothetical protein